MFTLIIAYLILTIIRPQDYVVALAGVPILSVSLAGAALLWLIGPKRRFDQPQYLLLALFVAFCTITVFWPDGGSAAVEQLTSFAPTLVAFTLLANALDRPERVRTALIVLVLCTTVLAVHGIEQAKIGIGWTGITPVEGNRIRYAGIFEDPNDLGLLFVSVIPLAFYLSTKGGLQRLIWLTCAGLMIYGCYLTRSRGTMLALAAIFGVYIWRKRGLVPAGILGVAALVLMRAISPRMEELGADEASASGRVDAWYEGIQMMIQSPIFGVGANRFVEHNYLTAHNSFVLVMAETGFIGYTLWIAFIGYGLWMVVSVLRHQLPPEVLALPERMAVWKRDEAVAFALFLMQIAFLSAAFFLSRSYVIVLYLLQAVVVGYYTDVSQRFPSLPRFALSNDLVRWPMVTVASVIVMFLVVRVLLATS